MTTPPRTREELRRLMREEFAKQDRLQLTPYNQLMRNMAFLLRFTPEEQQLMCATPEELAAAEQATDDDTKEGA